MSDLIQQFVVVLFGSGASIAIASLFFQERREAKARKDAVTYLAIQLAFQLEAYVIRCANALSDHSTADSSDGHAGEYISSVPVLDPLPDNTAYQYLKPTLLGVLFDLSQRRDMHQEFGMFYWNMLGDEDATRGAMEENTTKMALAALGAADMLRATYPIGKRDLVFGQWNIRDYLDQQRSAILEREEREARQMNEAAKKMPPPLQS